MVQSHAQSHYRGSLQSTVPLLAICSKYYSFLWQILHTPQRTNNNNNFDSLATAVHNDEIYCARQSLSSPGNPTVTSLQVPWATLNCKHAHLLVATITASTIHQITDGAGRHLYNVTDGAGRHSLCAPGYKNRCCLLLCRRCSSPILVLSLSSTFAFQSRTRTMDSVAMNLLNICGAICKLAPHRCFDMPSLHNTSGLVFFFFLTRRLPPWVSRPRSI